MIEGQVVDTTGAPLEDAIVDLWQANSAGRYSHPHDSNPAPIDKHFQGWAIVPTNNEGRFKFKTVFPGAYPISDQWSRPPHIHFKVSKKGFIELVTQMYFPDHELNRHDRLLQRKSHAEQQRMIAKKDPKASDIFYYEIVLEKAV